MINQNQREALGRYKSVLQVTGRRKPEAQDPQHDVEVFSNGAEDLTPAFEALAMIVVSAHGARPIRPDGKKSHPTIWLGLKAPTGSFAVSYSTLWALWNCGILELWEDGAPIDPARPLPTDRPLDVIALSGNSYQLSKVGSDAFLLRAVDIVYDLAGDENEQDREV